MSERTRAWVAFVAMCLGMFAAILDIQIVAAALPRIASALKTPEDRLSWIQTAYLITEVIAIALGGRLSRALSTRVLFGGAMAGFVVTSLGCGFARDFPTLIVWRALQGLCGGSIIPTVFAAGYKMFPRPLHSRALLCAGSLAMLAPSLGPYLGGLIAQKLSWNWLFFVNVPIGLAVAIVTIALVDIDRADRGAWRTIDALALVGLATGLSLLETTLKVAPGDHWARPRDLALVLGTLAGCALFVRRCVRTPEALVDFAPLRSRGFSAACAYNFAIGLGLYGSVYTLPLFLGFVRAHSPLEIGVIMTVTGLAQLAAAPLAALAERRLPAWAVTGFGFALFAAGCAANAFETPRTDGVDLILPQALRGASVLFCILPVTNLALDAQPAERLASASGLLNLLRNIGGAVGIGLVDTVVNVQPQRIAPGLIDQLTRGTASTAAFVGIPVQLLAGATPSSIDPEDLRFLRPIVGRAAATVAFNEAWIVLAGLLALSLLALPFLRRDPGMV